ncbi:hypothetical protein AVDCRST_MAG92-2351 [uncultured Coleofasciculus sp.]|uniref:Glycosyl transferase, group 1 n=1 Tax=uncultured Coleofasciculus sp. TaxID=1267456 RepID=A0A6J4IRV2_9CYAN|nr:hypothetical protein AVDCRST_MAG92-2351 [uncultured Coleofasciculus sp.]
MVLGKPIVQVDLLEGKCSAGTASIYARPGDAVDFAEKIMELIEQPEHRRQMEIEEQLRIRELLVEWRQQTPRLLDAYPRALQDQKTPVPNKVESG